MKRLTYIIALMSVLPFFFSCSETDYPLFDDSVINIYFSRDSMNYSFGITPLTTVERVVELPVKIIGLPSKTARAFTIEVVADKTNAQENVHYTLPDNFEIAPDSVNGIVPVTILREQLGDTEWQLSIRLVGNRNFTPAPGVDKEMGAEATITFNNIITKPNWVNWQGKPDWPTFKLGSWNPKVYVLFMEYFHRLKDKAPMTYRRMVEKYGENLDNGKYSGWDWDYDYTLTKYILIPMYEYIREHPELGAVDFPNPNA